MKAYGVLFAGSILLGCHTRSSSPITLGAAGPWNEGYGLLNRRGVELAVEQINARGGIKGRPVQVVSRNDEGDGARAAAIAQEFVANPHVVAVIGHVNSGAMVAAAKIYEGNLPAVATSATSPDLTGISPWAFRVISSDSTNGLDLARFASKLGRRRAAILYENDNYGRGLAESFRRSFPGEVVSIDPIAADQKNFEPYVSYYKRVTPDIVFCAGTEESGMRILREARRQGLRADFLGGDGWTGVVTDTSDAEGAYVGAPFTAQDPRAEAQRFVTAYRARFKADPDGNAALAYDATMLVARAISERGSNRAAVRDYLASLDERTAFPGATGPLRFSTDGDPIGKGFVMTRVHHGTLYVAGGR